MYLVCHLPTEQLRAAKRLKSDHPEKRLRELTLMKKLKHPALPQILDVLEENGQIWLVMEYIRGRRIADIPQGEVSAHQFFSIAKQLAEVLVYLHTRSTPILHLDIKPANVLLRPDGRLVLIDFGAAIFLTPGKENTEGHFGTPGFAAPEQADKNGQADVRADVYGFGALLYYYLYRRVPGHREASCIVPEAAGFLRRCLHEDPDQRFGDSKMLYRAVCEAEKRHGRRRTLQKSLAAMALLAVVCAFAAYSLGPGAGSAKRSMAGSASLSDSLPDQQDAAYTRLLEQAERTGLAAAAGYYAQAAAAYPEKHEWCLRLIDRIGGDYVFEQKEEMILKELLYQVLPERGTTFLELQKDRPEEYGMLAYRLGKLYWYFYEETGGKSAAVSWFEQAASAAAAVQKDSDSKSFAPVWLERAQIYIRMGKYCEALGRKDENGKFAADYGTYWEDLKELWQLEYAKTEKTESSETENRGIRIRLADELLACMILHSAELCAAGGSMEEAERVIGSLEEFIRLELTDGEERDSRAQQCAAARAALQRTFGKGEQAVETE